MSKSLDQLAKDLAAGVSRRKALWRFVSGLGVVGVLAQRKASAIVVSFPGQTCEQFCQQQAQTFVNMCVAASMGCQTGFCTEFVAVTINGSTPTLPAINGTSPSIGHWVCVPDSIALPGSGGGGLGGVGVGSGLPH